MRISERYGTPCGAIVGISANGFERYDGNPLERRQSADSLRELPKLSDGAPVGIAPRMRRASVETNVGATQETPARCSSERGPRFP
jgi:hypothetical protein